MRIFVEYFRISCAIINAAAISAEYDDIYNVLEAATSFIRSRDMRIEINEIHININKLSK